MRDHLEPLILPPFKPSNGHDLAMGILLLILCFVIPAVFAGG